VRRRASCLFILAAILWCGCVSALAIRPDSLENRVGGCDQFTSGQTSATASQALENAMGFWGCGYETASGQRKWLNRDPIGERGGLNLYAYVGNSPINHFDPYGLAIGDWWDARTWFNSGFTESWSDSANSIGQALGGALAGNWDQVADAYDTGPLGQTKDADPVTKYGTRAAIGTATVCATAAAAVGTYEFVALGNQSIMVEGVLGGGESGSGGILQLRVPGEPPIIRFDYHPIPGSGGNPVPHIDSPPLGWHHWPW